MIDYIQKMEQFKACEKETKTKAYSKEGLGLQKHDNDALNQARSWVGMLSLIPLIIR
jgi:CCR4-NOT transcriptional regulation complex NOT5 subunit